MIEKKLKNDKNITLWPSPGGDGAEVIYALRNNSNLANLILDNLEEAGQNPRKAYQRRLPSDTSKDYYFIHRNTGVTEPVIVEYGFLDSTGDDVSQLKNNWQNLTEVVVKALAEYTNTPYDKGTSNTYIVKSGDTLWSIARKYNITVNDLKKLNNLTSNSLRIGQVLVVNEQDVEEPSTNTYIVKSGDTLYSIAKRYGMTVGDLKALNNLTSNTLRVGQTLKIRNQETDTDTEDYIVYTIKSGDTLYRIAQAYNVTPNQIMNFNNLNSTILTVGNTLKIPLSKIEEEEEEIEYVNYTVKRGDSLYSIARSYGVSVNDIMSLNKLNSNLLSVGQTLKIPLSETVDQTYIVRSGDSLYSIARRFNTTVDQIKQKNNLTSNVLSIGQILKI